MYDILTHDFWGNDILRRRNGGWTHDSWRPIVTLSFRLNHYMGGLDTFIYHATNIVIHCIVILCAYRLFWLLFTPLAPPNVSATSITRARKLPWGISVEYSPLVQYLQTSIATLFFGLHPIHSECVANITSRADPMAALFCILSAIVYLEHRPPNYYYQCSGSDKIKWRSSCKEIFRWIMSIVFILLGVACKETALTMPAVLVMLDIGRSLPAVTLLSRRALIARPTSTSTTTAGWSRCTLIQQYIRQAFSTVPIFRTILTVLMGAIIYYVRIIVFSNGYSLKDFANEMHNPLAHMQDNWARRRAKAYIQSFAMSKLVFPIWLSHEHNAYQPVADPWDPRHVLTVSVYSIVLFLIFHSLKGIWNLASGLVMGHSVPTSRESVPHPPTGTKAIENPLKQQLVESLDTREIERRRELVRKYRERYLQSLKLLTEFEDVSLPSSDDDYEEDLLLLAQKQGAKTKRPAEDTPTPETTPGSESDPLVPSPPRVTESAEKAWDSTALDLVVLHDLYTLNRATRVLQGIGWIIITYAPSSHAFLFVAFVLAERTLFFPSLGAALLMTEFFTVLSELLAPLFAPSGTSRDLADSAQLLVLKDQDGGDQDSGKTGAQGHGEKDGKKDGKKDALAPEKSSWSAVWRPGNLLTFGLIASLCTYYSVLLWRRNVAWATEENLLESNFRLYPEHNGMTKYGMGAVAFYKGNLEKAEEFLLAATVETTLAEPWILLSQLEWSKRNNVEKAIEYLSKIEHTTTPRKEVMQNLGILRMIKNPRYYLDKEETKNHEFLILWGHASHGYPMSHPNIAILASNAACVRMTSSPEVYADPIQGLKLFEDAIEINASNRPQVYKNLLLVKAALGDADGAIQVAKEAIAFLEDYRQKMDPAMVEASNVASSIQLFEKYIRNINVFRYHIAIWGSSPMVFGQAMKDRLEFLGGGCDLQLLHW